MGSKGEVILTLGCFLAGFQVKYSLILSTMLRMAMTVELDENASNGQAFESALHTYLRIEDIHRVSVEGLEGTAYLDKVGTPAQRPASNSPIRFQGETDRVYGDTEATCFLNDPGMNRRIRVSKTGSRSTVIWNPWIDKSRRMQDFGDQEWQTMVCIETANIGSNAISLEPGEMHTMTADLEVLPSVDAR
jgi:D-hexose-6-phosphate mutarotase